MRDSIRISEEMAWSGWDTFNDYELWANEFEYLPDIPVLRYGLRFLN